MLSPKKVKHRKMQKGRMRGKATRGAGVEFGDYGLLATTAGWVTARQIEASRITITRKIRKFGRMWIRIFPDKPISRKPAETRMGKGKGSPEAWVCPVKRGKVMFEVGGVPEELAVEALTRAAHKLPILTNIV